MSSGSFDTHNDSAVRLQDKSNRKRVKIIEHKMNVDFLSVLQLSDSSMVFNVNKLLLPEGAIIVLKSICKFVRC